MSENQKVKVFPIILAVIIVGVLLLLAMTNPKKPEYVTWAKDQTVADSSTVVEKTLKALLAPAVVENNTTVNNYVLFTVFTTNVGGQEIKVIGIINNFIVMSTKNSPN